MKSLLSHGYTGTAQHGRNSDSKSALLCTFERDSDEDAVAPTILARK